jgi:hypothetical protein
MEINQVQNQIMNQREPIVNLENVRILRRNLMYLTNIPEELANPEILESVMFLGQYGKINKVLVNKEMSENKKNFTFSAYVYFENKFDCSVAILSINGFRINNQVLNASFGMTRYCCFFLKNKICGKKNCSYVHYIAEKEDCTNNKNREINKKIRKFKKDKIIEYILRKNFNLESLKNSKYFIEDNSTFFFPFKYESYKKIMKYVRKLQAEKEKEIIEMKNKMMDKNYCFDSMNFKVKDHIFYPFNLAHKVLKKNENLKPTNPVLNYKCFERSDKQSNNSFNSLNTKMSNSQQEKKKKDFKRKEPETFLQTSHSIDKLVNEYLQKQKHRNQKSRFSFVESCEKKENKQFWNQIFNIFESPNQSFVLTHTK